MAKGKTAKHRSGDALRVELYSHDIFYIYPEIGSKIEKVVWMQFIKNFNGFHPQVVVAMA